MDWREIKKRLTCEALFWLPVAVLVLWWLLGE